MSFQRNIGILGVVVGLILIVTVGVVAWIVVPNIIIHKIEEDSKLVNGTDTWNKWMNTSIPQSMKFYIFTITNPQVLDGGILTTPLNFKQVGPYVYTQHRYKVDVGLGDEGQVIYKEKIDYTFDSSWSVGMESDVFNIPNIPLIAVATAGYAKKTGDDLIDLENLISNLTNLASEKLIKQNVSLNEILFEGWKLNSFYGTMNVQDFLPEFGDPQNPSYGLYKGRNGGHDGQFIIKSGEADSEEFAQILMWTPPGGNLNQTELNWWFPHGGENGEETTQCNKINGTDGSLFPAFLKKKTNLRLFQSDLCRSLYLSYGENIELKEVPGYRFVVPEQIFEDPLVEQDNLCFCPDPSPQFPGRLASNCEKGVMRLFPCKHGIPLVISNPHFFESASVLSDPITIDGIDPEPGPTFFDIEQESGTILRWSRKTQLNIELQNLPLEQFKNLDFSSLTKSKSILLPILWSEQTSELDDESCKLLYEKYVRPIKVINVGRWVAEGIGIVIFTAGVIAIFRG